MVTATGKRRTAEVCNALCVLPFVLPLTQSEVEGGNKMWSSNRP